MTPAQAFEAASCTGKEAFDQPFRAYEVARKMIRSGKIVQPYRCSVCGLFHVGRKP